VWGEQRWGARRLLAHVDNLPPDSALTRSQLNAPMGWDNGTELAASTVDLLQVLVRSYTAVNSEGGGSNDPVVPVARPYAPAAVPETIALADFGSLLKE